MFILPMLSFYQGTTSAPSTAELTSAETGGIGENLFSSSLIKALSLVDRPLFKTSLSSGFYFLPFSSPRHYQKYVYVV